MQKKKKKGNNAYEKYTKLGYYPGKQLSIGTGFIYSSFSSKEI